MTGAELKASILQAAVQGRLVPQDPTDKPASALLDRIREERRALVKAKKAKAPKGGESVIARYGDGTVWETRGKGKAVEITNEVPFDIPDGWEWSRLETVCASVTDGDHQPPPKASSGIPFLVISNVSSGAIDMSNTRFVPQQYFDNLSEDRKAKEGDLLFTVTGSYGVVVRVDTSDEFCFQRHIALIKPLIDEDYLRLSLMSPATKQFCDEVATGTAQKTVSIGNLRSALVPIPPLAEQRRIVAKLNELMPLVERYDRLDRERTALNAGIEGAMRASVLQAAMQGHLTEREDGDEPASELLERIREERAELVRQKKAKPPKDGESRIWRASDGTVWEQSGKGKAVDITDEVPFDIPDGWEWARFDDVGMIAGGGTPDKSNPEYWGGDIFWASVKDIKGDCLTETIDTITDAGLESKASISECVPGDLIVATRLVPGKSIICQTCCVINQDLKRIRSMLDVNYLHFWFQSERPRFHKLGQGTTVPGIKLDVLQTALIPIPPLAEQRRIVAKLDEMLPKVERLGELASLL